MVEGRRRVRSVLPTFEMQRLSRPQLLRPKTKRNGYREVCLQTAAGFQMASLHRLVLLAFVGDPPTIEHQGDHINGRRGDNRLPNLRWVTPLENTIERFHTRSRPSRRLPTLRCRSRRMPA